MACRFTKIVFCILVIPAYFAAEQYILCPKFSFKSRHLPVTDSLFNPYQGISLSDPLLINFHGHTNAWNGLTNGKSTVDKARKRYDSLGYDYLFLSQYQKINKNDIRKYGFSVYEHGFNCTKTHQLIIGSKAVCWRDYFFPQTLDQKQHILNLLSADTGAVVVLNHPGIRNAYSVPDLKDLYKYNMIECLRPGASFTQYWDTALSNQHWVSVMGNDDFHNIYKDEELGNCLNLIFEQSGNIGLIPSRLKTGACAAVQMNHPKSTTLANRAVKIKRLRGLLKQLKLSGNKLITSTNEPVNLVWRGRKGIVHTAMHVMNDKWNYPKTEPYIRLELETIDSIRIFFNPVHYLDKSSSRTIIDETTMKYLTKKDNGAFPDGSLLLISTILFIWWKIFPKKRKHFHDQRLLPRLSSVNSHSQGLRFTFRKQ